MTFMDSNISLPLGLNPVTGSPYSASSSTASATAGTTASAADSSGTASASGDTLSLSDAGQSLLNSLQQSGSSSSTDSLAAYESSLSQNPNNANIDWDAVNLQVGAAEYRMGGTSLNAFSPAVSQLLSAMNGDGSDGASQDLMSSVISQYQNFMPASGLK